MNTILDYYEVLGIPRDASPSTIRKAFRREILKWHPDKNKTPEAITKTQLILEAWEILRQTDKKKAYDDSLRGIYNQNTELWQQQARDMAKVTIKKSLQDILKAAGIRTARFLVGCLIGLINVAFVVGGTVWITNKLGGLNGPHVYFIFFGSSLFLWLGSMLLFNLLKKKLFNIKCNHCGRKFEYYFICPKCGLQGCYACIGIPINHLYLDGKFPQYKCKKCFGELEHIESPKHRKAQQWIGF